MTSQPNGSGEANPYYETEMLDVIRQILAESALFAVVMRGEEWAGTTLIRRAEPKGIPQLGPNEVAHIVSWPGNCDRTIESGNADMGECLVSRAIGNCLLLILQGL